MSLFGITPMLRTKRDYTELSPNNDDDELVLPLASMMRLPPHSPAYSPNRWADVREDSPIAPPPRMVGGESVRRLESLRVKKRERRKRQRRQQRLLRRRKSVVESAPASEVSVYSREGKRDYSTGSGIDPYYSDRYRSAVEIDPRLASLVTLLGNEYIADKRVADLGCGAALVSFYIAAYLGARHVVAVDSDMATTLANLKQLRKFKHEGIQLQCTTHDDDYPAILVKRTGPVRGTNKPWVIKDEFCANYCAPSNHIFPFNIEFQRANVLTDEIATVPFDVVLCLKLTKYLNTAALVARLAALVASGGLLVVQYSPGDGFLESLARQGATIFEKVDSLPNRVVLYKRI